MRNRLSKQEFLQAWERVMDRLEGASDELNRLDAAAGDGDLGVTISIGCRAVRKGLPELAGQDIGTIVARSGMVFNNAASSTFGALFAIGAMRAGREARAAEEVDLGLLARMVRAAEAGIKEKGKAERGDRTLLDALGPSGDALAAALADGKGLLDAVESAVDAARAGVESTKQMKAKSGRAAWIAERSAGQQDPGATVILFMWEAMGESLRQISRD
jgi:phosphoenolpyruvate---glycerone phosphotransferase subunit DhaL